MHDDIVHEENYLGYDIKIRYSEIFEDPNEMDDGATFIAYDRRNCWYPSDILNEDEIQRWYTAVYYKQDRLVTSEDLENDEELVAEYGWDDDDNLIQVMEDYHIFAVAAYIHSGIALSLCNHRSMPGVPGEHRGWDTGQIGVLLIEKTGIDGIRDEGEAFNVAEGVIEAWNNTLNGQCYGWDVELNGDYLEGCGGYLGDWDAPFGALAEAQAFVNWEVSETKKRLMLNRIA